MRAALLVAAAVVLAGCQPSEQDRVRDAVMSFVHAFADGDVKTACARLVPEVREAFDEGCEAGLKKETDALSKADRERLRSLEVGSVYVTGHIARVRLEGQRGEPGRLRKVDGEWLIESR